MILEAGTGGSTLLSKLEDVTLTNLADGQILKYDAASKNGLMVMVLRLLGLI